VRVPIAKMDFVRYRQGLSTSDGLFFDLTNCKKKRFNHEMPENGLTVFCRNERGRPSA
jgi:hypothetical protein